MAVPETSVYKYAGPVFRQNDVRSTGKLSDIDPVPVPLTVEYLPKQYFRLRILGPDVRHTIVPLLCGESV